MALISALYTALGADPGAPVATPADGTSRSTPGFVVAASYEGGPLTLPAGPAAGAGSSAMLSPARWVLSKRASRFVLACNSAFWGANSISKKYYYAWMGWEKRSIHDAWAWVLVSGIAGAATPQNAQCLEGETYTGWGGAGTASGLAAGLVLV